MNNKYALAVKGMNGENNAGSKASNDALEIVSEIGYIPVELYRSNQTKTKVRNVIKGIYHTYRLCKQLRDGDLIFLQYPMNRFMMGKIYQLLTSCKKKLNIITLIHDVDFLRNVSLPNGTVEDMKQLELSLLRQSDIIIAHNASMIQALKDEGLEASFVSLELFDYLYNGRKATISSDRVEVIVAGNLLENKAGYLYKLDDTKQHFSLSLYGSNLAKTFKYKYATYHGSFSPNQLIENLYGTYGLVWDGDSLGTCSGNYGGYLRINNPHKVSLYIASGLPVIVWKKSALYPFIHQNELGFGIDSLEELDEKIESEQNNYCRYRQNVEIFSERVTKGQFLKAALEKAERMVKDV